MSDVCTGKSVKVVHPRAPRAPHFTSLYIYIFCVSYLF